MDTKAVLAQLCALPGPSGFEGPVARAAAELLSPLMDEVSINRLGSVVGVRRCGRAGAPRLLLDAHLDEIGVIVTGAEKGFLRFQTIGGVDPRMLYDREITLLTQPPRTGVVACLPPHVQTAEERDKSVPVSQLYLDLGLTQEEASELVPVGTPGVFRSPCRALGEDQFCAKSLDDRSCVAALLMAAELLRDRALDVDLYVLFSTQEETSSAGAVTSVWDLRPDMCVCVDVTHAQTPDAPKHKALKLGGGPAIGVGPNMSRWMTQHLTDQACSMDMGHQLEVMAGHTGTNAWPIQISREGIATAVVSLPLKYMHTPVEVISLSDLEAVARLLAAFAAGLGKEGTGSAG